LLETRDGGTVCPPPTLLSTTFPRTVHLTRQALKPCPSGHVFDALHLSTTSPPAEHRKSAHLGMVSMLGVCQLSRTSKPCPFGHIFDAWCLSTTSLPASIGKMPRWAWFRCSASVNCPEHRNCAHLGTFSMFRLSTTSPSPEHQNRAHLDTVLILGVCPPHPYPLNIEKMPRWTWFRCSASVYHPEHRNCAHLDMFSMLSVCPPPPYPLNIEIMPIWACFRCSAHVHYIFTKAMLRCTCLDVRR